MIIGHLPDVPDTYGPAVMGARQQWRSGAFGEREDLVGVETFVILEEEWAEDKFGHVYRTILRGRVADLEEE